MRILTDLSDGYWNKDVKEFLEKVERACEMLDVLEQIQSCAGGLSMQGRARETGSVRAHLENMLPAMHKAADEDYKRMRGQ